MTGSPPSQKVAVTGRRDSRHGLSRTQQLIWASQRLHPSTPLANMGDRIRICGPLDPDRFVASFDAVVRHADLLRMVVPDGANEAHILTRPPRTTEVIDLPSEDLEPWSSARIATPIDASTCVYDSVLLRHADDDWTWWIDVHHVAVDAWSAARLADAMAAAYGTEGDPADADLSEIIEHDFYDHVEQLADPDGAAVATRAAEWAAEAADADPNQPLVLFDARGPRTTRVDRMEVPLQDVRDRIDEALAGEYRSLSPELGLLTITAMATMILVHRLDGRSTVTVGVPVHHRSGPVAPKVIGPLMELYPLHLRFDPSETHREMFRRTMRSVFAVLRRARPGESPATPFEIVLNVTTARYGRFAGMPATREWMRSGHVDPNHGLRVQIFDHCDPAVDGDDTHVLRWELDLNECLSTDGAHRRLPEWFATVVGDIAARPDEPAGRISIVGDERADLARLNPVPAVRHLDRPVHERIRDELRQRPDRIVAEHHGATMTARELDDRAEQTAEWLVRAGVTPGRSVGIRMRRGPDVLVAIQGVLRSGARFVMLDPEDPPARHESIRADADLVTIIDEIPAPPPPGDASPIELPEVGLDDGAYLLYTSGSTGEPKGVPISHRGLADYLDFAKAAYCDGNEPPVVALHSSLVFDLTITSLFLSLLTGGRTVVFDGDPVDALERITRDPRLTFLKATPSQLEILSRLADEPLGLKVIVVGGEAFRRPVAERTRNACVPGVRIFNEYGPTEAVVGCMIHEYDPATDTGADVPIGHAAPGTQVVVLDPLGQLTPVGSWGELYVRRPGMATEYLNRPELSAERFVSLELPSADAVVVGTGGPDIHGPWYRTGDRVRVERPGVLVFGGRRDDQLKVNGIRLEPGEVEAALVAHPEVDTALVRMWHPRDPDTGAATRKCIRCGLGADVPGVELDDTGICSTCHQFELVEPQTRQWFRTEADLEARLDAARSRRSGELDCLHLLSGGKDSTYALYQLVERGWRVHALTLDNGFISDGAKENIRRTITDLGISHEFVTTPAMNEILRDSLDRHSNVCQGCYKTIYTLAVARADEMGIPVVATGLSRGQFFETRLLPHQFEAGRFDPDEIDHTVLEARRVYHHTEDAVTTLLPEQRVFDDDEVFERIEFVDFYRYVDVELAEMYDFLEHRAPWVRPADTGRSTNCLINVAGISVHRAERGYHNYAEPYSWDVRLGHKTRAEALEELDDEIDDEEVARLLAEVGYQPKTQGLLTAWYQTSDGTDLDPDELRGFLRQRLPDHAVPTAFVRVEEVPLAASAKADPELLPAPTRFHRQGGERVAPTTPTEAKLTEIWADVLGLESVGTTDDFFDLGGASLDALEVAARIDQEFGTDVPDAAVFRDRTIGELAGVVDDHRRRIEEADERTVASTIASTDATTPLALSAGEEAMLFEYRSDPSDTRYNVTRLYRLRGDVDPGRLETALRDVVMAHEPLHTCFDADRTQLGRTEAVEFVRLGSMTDAEMADFADRQRRVPFDLDRGPLVRVHLARTAADEVAVLIGMHHITVDAGTFDTFWHQVAQRAEGGPLPPLALTYSEHAQIQRAEHATDRTHRTFWAERAARREPVPALGVARPTPPEPDGYLERVPELSVQEMRSLRHTPFAASLAAAGAVVSTFSGGPAVEIGVTTSTKDRPEAADIVGYYLNTVATSLAVDHEATFTDLTAAASAEVAEVLPHRTYPFASVVREARAAQRPVPDISVMLAYERLEEPTFPGAVATQQILASGTSVSEVTFFVQERHDEVRLGLEYRGSVIARHDAQRLLDAFAEVLTNGVRDPSRTVDDLTAAHRAPDLVGPELRDRRLVLERFLGHVQTSPDAVAVADAGGNDSTFRDLAHAVADLATRLEAAEGSDSRGRIGISVGRSVDLVVAVLATQFAGGAYVPLDPTLPAARLEFLARTADLDLLVTDDPTRNLGLNASRVVPVDGNRTRPTGTEALGNLQQRLAAIDPDDPAYVIFTSGSTGQPRGVAISHANLAASTAARDVWYAASPSRFLVTPSPGFDSSVVGLFWPLATGGTVVLPSDDDVHDVDRLGRIIDEQTVSHALMVPSLARALLDRCPDRLGGLDTFIVAGEACPSWLPERFAAVLPGVTLVNEYGPTETTVWATAHRIVPGEDPVPIGRPIAGTTVRIADRALRRVPHGVAGELLIAGPGVCTGYVDAPDATRHGFLTLDGTRWYRTGDLVREVDGVIHFLGRTDDQLNVGGVRIEPTEIERALDSLPSVIESVVIATGTPPVLVAHLVTDDPEHFDEVDLRRQLGERLPTAAVPRRFIAQPALPRTPNGKLDRATARSLPEPTIAAPPTGPVDPSGESRLAEKILAAWRTALAPSRIDLDTDFFAAGGDSLAAVELVTDLGGRLGRSVPIALLLSGRTPAGMLATLQPAAGSDSIIHAVHFRSGLPGGPLVVITPSWADVFGYQALAEAFPDEVAVVGLAYEVQPGQTPVNRIPELVEKMQEAFSELETTDRPVVTLGYSMGGLSAVELAAQLTRAGSPVDAAVVIDTFFPGEERHRLSNSWWRYKSMLRRGTGPELRRELRSFLRRRSPRRLAQRIAGRLGRKLLAWSGTDVPVPAPPPRPFGSLPLEAFGHQPTAPGVPVVLYRASTTNPARTIERWRTVAPDIVDVEIEGRHRGFDSIMYAGNVERIADDLAARLRGQLPLSTGSG